MTQTVIRTPSLILILSCPTPSRLSTPGDGTAEYPAPHAVVGTRGTRGTIALITAETRRDNSRGFRSRREVRRDWDNSHDRDRSRTPSPRRRSPSPTPRRDDRLSGRRDSPPQRHRTPPSPWRDDYRCDRDWDMDRRRRNDSRDRERPYSKTEDRSERDGRYRDSYRNRSSTPDRRRRDSEERDFGNRRRWMWIHVLRMTVATPFHGH